MSRYEQPFTLRSGVLGDLDTLGEIDADAGIIFEKAGLFLDLPDTHEFPVAERRRWAECLIARTTLIAMDAECRPIGFVAVGRKDGDAYIAQLSVRQSCMRRGVGGALLEAAAEMSQSLGARALRITTYDHLPWNRPFYERHGFHVVPAHDCGPEMLAEYAMEKKWLPQPDQRVLMRRGLGAR
jgi:GNAT superfamily N-acetyltransferase